MRASSGVIPLILMTAAAILPNGGVHLPLSALARLLVVPMLAQIRENTGLLALLLEALEGPLEVLIVVDDDFRQLTCSQSCGARGKCIEARILCTDLNRCQEWRCPRSTGASGLAYPGGHLMCRPPMTWTWMWNTACPESLLVLITVR